MPGHRKVRQGIVVSDKMDKTVTVQVERLVRHSMYKKYVRQRKKYKAHGDLVSIMDIRPLGRNKHWSVQTVLKPGTPG